MHVKSSVSLHQTDPVSVGAVRPGEGIAAWSGAYLFSQPPTENFTMENRCSRPVVWSRLFWLYCCASNERVALGL